jgi:hypothetical protein
MPRDRTARYGRLYARLLRLYPQPFRDRFAEGMTQTFGDLCREREQAGGGLPSLVLWLFAETSVGILKERMAMSRIGMKQILRPAVATAAILLIPLVATRLSDEVAWSAGDFLVAAILLFGAGFAFEMAIRRAGGTAYRAGFGLAVAAGLMLVWMNLAVGLIGSEGNPANLLYLAVLIAGFGGAVIARFRPRGMARAMIVTAVVQVLVPVVALLAFRPAVEGSQEAAGIAGLVFLNTFFVLLFLASALLFRRAGAGDPSAS